MSINELETNSLELDLQFFSEEKTENEDGAAEEKDTGSNPGDKGENNPDGGGEDDKEDGEGDEDKVEMTQTEFDKIIEDRLARERKKQEDKKEEEREKAEHKRLEEKEEYKKLAEKLQNQLDEQKEAAVDTQKDALLTQAGYSEDQINFLKDSIKGDDSEAIKESVEEMKKVFPPEKTYADPSTGNGKKGKPEQKSKRDVGASAFERIKGKLR